MSLTKDDLTALSKLLDEALDIPEAEREAWLGRLSDRYASLRPTLRELLTRQASVETDDFLKTLPKFASNPARASPDVALQPGIIINDYRLVREIGHGGMSSVWLAERSDDAVRLGAMKRMVALKLPFAHLHRPQYIERFARERDILAGLAHPNIARLYDAGVTPLGQPFLAMEYIEGVPLIEHCDAQRFDTTQRLKLFTHVLAAVQHAHSQLVIHRDLKPSNILVTAENQVALLDFGIAKLIVDGEAKETELTQLGGRALTLNYASPEQIAGQPLGTASDIYSLGVILYELLTGTLPYKLKRDSRGAVEDAILAAEPAKPSQSIGESLVAASRATTVGKLSKLLKGDLDTIVLKALKKSSAERYATAQAFADDIERFLDHQPVLARPDSFVYRARKFIYRNKLAMAAAAGVFVALAAGMSIALWQAHVARVEQQRAQAVQDFLLDIFRANTTAQQDPLKGRQTTAQELLDIGAKRIGEKLKDIPEAQQQVMDVVADMYFEMGLSDQATDMRRQRIVVLKQIYGARSVIVADALLSFAEDVSETADRSQLFAALSEAQTILDSRNDQRSATRGRLLLALTRYYRYVDIVKCRDYADQAVDFFKGTQSTDSSIRAMRFAGTCRDLLGEQEAGLIWHRRVVELSRQSGLGSFLIVPLGELAENQTSLLQLADAERSLREAHDLGKRFAGEGHIQTIQTELLLGRFLYLTSRQPEARPLLRHALDTVQGEKIASGELPEVMGYYGWSLLFDGRLADSEPYIAADVDDLRKNYPGSKPLTARLATQGLLYTELGRFEEADKVLREALETWRKSAGPTAVSATDNLYLLRQARLEIAMNKPAEALATLGRVGAPTYAAHLPLPLDELNAKTLMAAAYVEQGKDTDAAAVAGAVLAKLRQSPLRNYYQTLEADASLWLGEAQLDSGDSMSARGNLEHALRLRQTNLNDVSPEIAQVEIALADCHIDLGDLETAKSFYAKAAAVEGAHKELGKQYTEPLKKLASRLAIRERGTHQPGGTRRDAGAPGRAQADASGS